ncbi:MAG: DUF892 family protein, partial [Bacteroidetes bacterium]|nr:DUF892 family protein [Bacteroidota bacterium]
MKDQIKHIISLRTLLNYNIRKAFIAEMQLRIALVDWMNSVSSEKFKNILQKYFDYIHRNIDTLQTYLEKEKINPLDLSNIIMTAHIEDLYERQSYCYDNEIKDACLLAAVQEIIHYKISVYGTVA